MFQAHRLFVIGPCKLKQSSHTMNPNLISRRLLLKRMVSWRCRARWNEPRSRLCLGQRDECPCGFLSSPLSGTVIDLTIMPRLPFPP